MAEELRVPKLGMASAVVTLLEWKVSEGEWVERGDAVLDIEAEKTAFEMEAAVAGHLHILMDTGIEVDVGTVVGLIATTKEEYSSLLGGSATNAPRGELADGSRSATSNSSSRHGAPTFLIRVAGMCRARPPQTSRATRG